MVSLIQDLQKKILQLLFFFAVRLKCPVHSILNIINLKLLAKSRNTKLIAT